MSRIAITLAALALLAAPAFAEPDPLEQQAIDIAAKLGGKAVVDVKLEESARVAIMLDFATDPMLLLLCKQPCIGGIVIDDASKCTEKGYVALKELPNLQKLVLGKSAITDKGIAAVGSIRPIQLLYLGEAKISDTGLAGLVKMKNLHTLDLYEAKITDKGLPHLAALVKLEELNLSGTKVTDKGIETLATLVNLKLLRLNRTDVTRTGVSKLETALPKATIRW